MKASTPHIIQYNRFLLTQKTNAGSVTIVFCMGASGHPCMHFKVLKLGAEELSVFGDHTDTTKSSMGSSPVPKRQKTSDAPDCTSCRSPKATASAQHLPCLRRFLNSPDGLSERSASAALDRVAAHAKAPSSQSRDCTGCIRALLRVEPTPAAKTKRYVQAVTPLSLSAAAGCESCVEALLEHHLQHDNKLSFTQWHDAVRRAVGRVQLGVVQKLFTAIRDEVLKHRVRRAAIEFALDHHQRQFLAGGSEQLHSSCAGMMQIFSWLRDEVRNCQCWGNEQARCLALSSTTVLRVSGA
jgi:hypothetical protein